ncbi:MAG: hypothetical protein GY727_15095, partial [Gammaproteobacteria bacterium]|nr:hypothetical protein [Gammaproteobacteria bacterium]
DASMMTDPGEWGPGVDTTALYYGGHAWGTTFLEAGVSIKGIRDYYMAHEDYGQRFFNDGDVLAFIGHLETPQDDWGVDTGPRGEYTIPDGATVTESGLSITLDGHDGDWANLPTASAVNNADGYFPDFIGAAVNDTVDLKDTKIAVDGDNFYWYESMWADQAWPNNAKQKLQDGIPVWRSRGYYHILIDIDNDRTTGWDPAYFEAHYTPLGYLMSQEIYAADATIGCEVMLEVGIKCNYSHEEVNDLDPTHIGHVPYSISWWAADYSGYDGATDVGSEIGFFDINANNVKETLTYEDGFGFEDASMMTDPGEWGPGVDTTALYYGGHAWGTTFLEAGVSIKGIRDYYMA